jgi:hypothetical protein
MARGRESFARILCRVRFPGGPLRSKYGRRLTLPSGRLRIPTPTQFWGEPVTYITNKDYFHEVSVGRVGGADSDVVLSSQITVDTGLTKPPLGGNAFFSLNAETIELFSSTIFDDGVLEGAGMWTVEVVGLDVNHNEISEIVTLQGTTHVFTTQSFLRVLRVVGEKAGFLGWNNGEITIRGSVSLVNYGVIETEIAQSRWGTYTIPAAKVGKIQFFNVNCTQSGGFKNNIIDIFVFTKRNIADATWLTQFETRISTSSGFFVGLDAAVGFPLLAETDIRIFYKATQPWSQIHSRMSLVLETA